MSYSEWLGTLVSPISNFVNWLSMVADSLIHNYFFITLLGITLFLSSVWLVYSIIDWFFYSKINDYDDIENKYYDYCISKKVQSRYLDEHYLDEFEYRYKIRVLSEQVLTSFLLKNKDLIISNRRDNLRLLHKAKYGNIPSFDENSPAYNSYVDSMAIRDLYNSSYEDYEIGRRARNSYLNYKASRIAKDRINDELLPEEREKLLQSKDTFKNTKLQSEFIKANKEQSPVSFVSYHTNLNNDKYPDWFGKDIPSQPLTEDEKKELDDVINNF